MNPPSPLPPMSRRHAVRLAALAAGILGTGGPLLSARSTAASATPPTPVDAPASTAFTWAGATFSHFDGFSRLRQGVRRWYYEDWDGHTYAPMYFDHSFRAWHGRSNYSLIGWNGATTIHPGDATDTVLTFIAPVDGRVHLTGTISKRDTNGGDGVQARVLVNEQQVWPDTGWASIAATDAQGVVVNLTTEVRRGEPIRFVLHRLGNINNDSTWWNPLVTYESSPAPAPPTITGVVDAAVYPRAAQPQLSAASGCALTATLAREGQPPMPFHSGQRIATPGRYVLRATAANRDGHQAETVVTFRIGAPDRHAYPAAAGEGWSIPRRGSFRFVSPTSGTAYLTAEAHGAGTVRIAINGRQVLAGQAPATVSVPVYLSPGDHVEYTADTTVRWEPAVTFEANRLVHYAADNEYLGDVHPFYTNGTMYLYSLSTDGAFAPRLATSTDCLHWRSEPVQHVGDTPAAQNYYVLGILSDGDAYRSWYGNGNQMRASVSTDLHTWADAGREYDIPNTVEVYQAGARDPYVFWDPDVRRYRLVGTAYRANANWGIGSGVDVSVSLTTSTTAALRSWQPAVDMKRWTNDTVAPSAAVEPECSQMFKLGNRWYLLASLSHETIHGVGGPTYWIGEPGTHIDGQDWSAKPRQSLDGQDVCAAQVVQVDDRLFLMGWIPQDAAGNAWGGHLCLPRELTARHDGTLAVRLVPELAASLSAGRVWPTPTTRHIQPDTGTWHTTAAGAACTSDGWSLATIPAPPGPAYVRVTVDLDAGTGSAGLLLDAEQLPPLGVEVTLDQRDSQLRIRHDTSGNGDWVEYASCPVRAGDLRGEVAVNLVVEGDIVELFVNDTYALVGRVPVDLSAAQLRLFADGGPATFSGIEVGSLA